MKKYLITLMFIVSLTALLMAGCNGNSGSSAESLTGSETKTEAVTETTTEDPLTLNPSLMGIATKYGDLLYPGRWRENLRTNVTEKDGVSTVEFYATVGEHEEIHLYDVLFDGDDGVCVGAFEADGKKVYVNIVSYDSDIDDSWTEEERLTLQAMKEDINYLIDELN